MQGYIRPFAIAGLLGIGAVSAADDETADRLNRLERVIEQQQRELQEMRSAMTGQQYLTHEEAARLIQNEMTALIDARVESGLAQMRDSSPILTLGPNIDGLDIRGDLRLRYERREQDMASGDDSSRDRYRVRLRVGGQWSGEGWEIGLGLATGDNGQTESYYKGSGTSTNQTFNDSSVFQTNNINLDYAYAKHSWGDFSLTLGQMKNPFLGSFIMWDSDVRPVGVMAHYEYQGFFATGGIFPTIHSDKDEAEGFLSAIQLGYEGKYDQLSYEVATSFYYFNKATIDDQSGIEIDASDYDYGFHIWDLYGALSYKFNDVKIGAHGHFLYNVGADDLPDGMSAQVTGIPGDYQAEDNNMAWLLGMSLSYMGFTLGYDYAVIEGDSAFFAVNDSDFGEGVGGLISTDVRGHKVSLKYAVTKNLSLEGTAYFTEPIERESGVEDARVYQVDAVWKF